MNNAIMRPVANPTTIPAATPRQSTFCSLFVIWPSQGWGYSNTTLGQTEPVPNFRTDPLPNYARMSTFARVAQEFSFRLARRIRNHGARHALATRQSLAVTGAI